MEAPQMPTWQEYLHKLKQSSAKCPSCNVLHNLSPKFESGQVENLEASGGGIHVFIKGAYPVFSRPEIALPGYAVVRCNNCGNPFVVAIPWHEYLEPEVVWPISGVEVSSDVPTEGPRSTPAAIPRSLFRRIP